jgi:acetylornithine deacetylase/succinyl-diaminopimelate desuccinylase-like protein
MIPPEVLKFIDDHQEQHVRELLDFLKIPSVSADPRHGDDLVAAAQWVQDHLQRLGFDARVFETAKHPVVYGGRYVDPNKPTLLVYGHYDVQPPDPEKEWTTPPFAPTVRDNNIYGRGASDDKGQFFTYLKAMEAVLANNGDLPINVEVLAEGEEEIGSPSLPSFLETQREAIRARVIAVSDGAKFDHQTPAITYGLRGLCYMQLDVQGPRVDLHSGSFGGLVTNPIQALAAILSALQGPEGSIALPGFYDAVAPLEDRERREMAELPFDEEALREHLGVEILAGEANFSALERKTVRPTLDVNGIWGGFAGQGEKTVIPAHAGAKISMRLVPHQDPKTIGRCFREFVHQIAPPGVRVRTTELSGALPVLVSRDRPEVRCAARAIETGFGRSPVFVREGGSIPVVGLFKEMLGLDTILMLGWGNADDGAHSPNERFHLEDFRRGTRAAAALFFELAD